MFLLVVLAGTAFTTGIFLLPPISILATLLSKFLLYSSMLPSNVELSPRNISRLVALATILLVMSLCIYWSLSPPTADGAAFLSCFKTLPFLHPSIWCKGIRMVKIDKPCFVKLTVCKSCEHVLFEIIPPIHRTLSVFPFSFRCYHHVHS